MRSRHAAHVIAAALLVIPLAACNRDEPATQTTETRPVNPADVYPDADTRVVTAVQAKYYGDDAVRGQRLDVSAQNGIVTLRGTVASEAARQRAVELAKSVEGVTTVTDQLVVRQAADERPDRPTSTTGTTHDRDRTSPAWITTKIQAQYFINPEIKPWNIDVTTGSGGVVTLEGVVDSADDKTEAVRIARETEGVARVVDRLRVGKDSKTGDTAADDNLSDAWLTSKIQAKYFLDDIVKARNIDVDTEGRVVTLTGTVGSEAERRQALALARNTDGVNTVTDRLRVDPKAAASDLRTEAREEIREVKGLPRPDPWVTMKVQAQYFLDPDVKGHQIDVDTINGVVTLKGSVQTEAQKQEAGQIARDTEGVQRVVNQLSVTPASNR